MTTPTTTQTATLTATETLTTDAETVSDFVKTPVFVPKKPRLAILVPLRKSLVIAKKVPALIRVGQRQMRKSYPSCPGYVQISAWSQGKSEFRDLSPFFLGPLVLDGLSAENFENAWQHQKVYLQHLDKTNSDLPNNDWIKWRLQGFSSKKAIRHPMASEKPIYCFYKGQKLQTVEARQQIYIPFYKELARKTAAYQGLLARLKAGQKLLIIEPDGPNLQEFPEGIEFTRELFQKLISVTDQRTFHAMIGKPMTFDFNKYFPLGHGYVLADALLEDL